MICFKSKFTVQTATALPVLRSIARPKAMRMLIKVSLNEIARQSTRMRIWRRVGNDVHCDDSVTRL